MWWQQGQVNTDRQGEGSSLGQALGRREVFSLEKRGGASERLYQLSSLQVTSSLKRSTGWLISCKRQEVNTEGREKGLGQALGRRGLQSGLVSQ